MVHCLAAGTKMNSAARLTGHSMAAGVSDKLWNENRAFDPRLPPRYPAHMARLGRWWAQTKADVAEYFTCLGWAVMAIPALGVIGALSFYAEGAMKWVTIAVIALMPIVAPFWAFRRVKRERDAAEQKVEGAAERAEKRNGLLTLAGKLSGLLEQAVELSDELTGVPEGAFFLSGMIQDNRPPRRAENWWDDVLDAVKGTEYEGHFKEFMPLTTTGDGHESAAARIKRRAGHVGDAIKQIMEDARALI